MVKKQEDDWKSMNLSNNSNQLRKYLDICKEWFIHNEINSISTHQFCNITSEFKEIIPASSLGINEIDIRNLKYNRCYLCKKETDVFRNIIANPFTRSQGMIVCNECIN